MRKPEKGPRVRRAAWADLPEGVRKKLLEAERYFNERHAVRRIAGAGGKGRALE